MEEYEAVVRNGKKEELRFLYLQLKPAVGLLVYNFCHTMKKGDFQGFDMFVYDSDNVKDATYKFLEHPKYKKLSKVGLLCIQDKIEQTRIIIEQLQKEESNDYFSIESKFVQLVKETYKRK